jgi:hypothetical protein
LREYLLGIAPDIVGLAEGFSDSVYFIPASALGRMPEFDESKSIIGIKPDQIKPVWVEVPMLLLLHFNDMIPAASMVNDVELIESYNAKHQHITFNFPGKTKYYNLPAIYCGRTVYCSEDKKFYRLPEYPADEAARDSNAEKLQNTSEMIDSDFWNS